MEKPKPKPKQSGRPPAGPALRKKTIGVRVSDDELGQLKAKARAAGLAPASLLRSAALDAELPPLPVPAINRQAYADLARLASNINQLARAAHEGRAVVDADLLERTRAELSRLRLALVGAG